MRKQLDLSSDPHINHGIRDLLVDRVPAIIWTTDKKLQITSCGGLSFVPYDRGPEELVGMTLNQYLGTGNTALLHIADFNQIFEGIPLSFDARYNGRAFTIRIEPLLDDRANIIGSVGLALDVSDRKASEESMTYLATHDPLTDLSNYRALLSCFDAELQRSDRTGRPFTALLLDADGLKNINDRYGHLVGSKALCRIAHVLKRSCRSIDTVARYGGDEFAVLLVETEESAAHIVAQRIRDELASDKEEPCVTASIGIIVYPRDGYTVENLLAGADRMLYRNKLRLKLRKQWASFQSKKTQAENTLGFKRRRSQRILQDVGVIVRGKSTDGEPFQEDTFTIAISNHGALLVLGPKVTIGQKLSVINPLTKNEKQARIVGFGLIYGGLSQVGIEFLEPESEFWVGAFDHAS